MEVRDSIVDMFGLGSRIIFHSEGKIHSHIPDCQLIELWLDQMFQGFFFLLQFYKMLFDLQNGVCYKQVVTEM